MRYEMLNPFGHMTQNILFRGKGSIVLSALRAVVKLQHEYSNFCPNYSAYVLRRPDVVKKGMSGTCRFLFLFYCDPTFY